LRLDAGACTVESAPTCQVVRMAVLVDLEEISRRLGIGRNDTVHNWRELGFPEPVGQIGNTPVWDWNAVERWARRTGRL
jgi:hypothetical protein